jgi:hypothetical protein
MALSAFDDKSHLPNEKDLSEMLELVSALWDDLKAHLASRYEPLTEQWNFSGKNYGWGLQLKQKKRPVLYMTPCRSCFLASFALGERAVQAAHQSGLPDSVLSVIDSVRKYAEGRGVRLQGLISAGASTSLHPIVCCPSISL